MNPRELTDNGEPTGVWVCGECRTPHCKSTTGEGKPDSSMTRQAAEACCVCRCGAVLENGPGRPCLCPTCSEESLAGFLAAQLSPEPYAPAIITCETCGLEYDANGDSHDDGDCVDYLRFRAGVAEQENAYLRSVVDAARTLARLVGESNSYLTCADGEVLEAIDAVSEAVERMEGSHG